MAFNAQRVDRKKVDDGTWISLYGARWKIARARNAQALEVVERLRKKSLQDGSDHLVAAAQAVAEGILRGWEDVVDRNGEPIPYNVDNAIEVLIDNPEVGDALLFEAQKSENFYRDDVAEQAKKPQKRSATD